MVFVKTFVVRLFVPIEPRPTAQDAGLHGQVEEIGTSRNARFSAGTELLAFLVAAEAPGRESERSSQ